MNNKFAILLFVLILAGQSLKAAEAIDSPAAGNPATHAATRGVGEKVPSEDAVIKNLHCMGLVEGHTDIFRSACPIRDIAQAMTTTQPSDEQFAQAKARMQHLYDLGIRTIISFQHAEGESEDKSKEQEFSVVLEKSAAEAVGIHFIDRPMANSGPHSLQEMSDQAVMQWADSIAAEIIANTKDGGVLFHCSAGHDRAGIIAAYIRMKYQHWPVEQAIDEMRRLGHNWVKYSGNGGISSWHEEHLRAIAKLLAQ